MSLNSLTSPLPWRAAVSSAAITSVKDSKSKDLVFPEGGRFSLYAMAALLPLIPAKQRPTAAADWMTTDALIACPDPNCGARFRISRTGLRRFRHGECTVVPLPAKTDKHP